MRSKPETVCHFAFITFNRASNFPQWQAQNISRWPSSSGGGLQNRRGGCNPRTGFHFYGSSRREKALISGLRV